eukprot:scaffold2383_cov111-Alexandrium_tamarense.AAC.4
MPVEKSQLLVGQCKVIGVSAPVIEGESGWRVTHPCEFFCSPPPEPREHHPCFSMVTPAAAVHRPPQSCQSPMHVSVDDDNPSLYRSRYPDPSYQRG